MSNLCRGIEEPILALVDRWIIDYFCRILWTHFEEQGTVINDWIDGFISERQCIQVLETQPGDNLDLLELQSRLLIQFMCRMSAGSFGTTIVDTDSEDGRTELEDAIALLEQIVAIGNHGLSSADLLRIRVSVKQQAVYACCREGNFELAAKVFWRQWKTWDTEKEMEARKNIAEVLDSRNHIHEQLKSLTYENTINDCKQILRKIFNNMAPPFLVTAAKNVWERMKGEDVVKKTDSDFADLLKVKKEKTDKGVLFNRQADDDMSDSLVNEVCARNGSMLTSTSSVGDLQIMSDSREPGIYAPSETLVNMMPAPNKSQTYPLILWTNSISSNVLPSAVSSTSVHTADEARVAVSNSFMQQRKEVVGPGQRMYLSLSSNQFSMPEEIYLNTVPVVSSQVYANAPLLQGSASLDDGGSMQQMWNVPASTSANVDFSITEPTVMRKRNRSRKRRRQNVNAHAAKASLSMAPVSQPLPLTTEVARTSPTIKQTGRTRGRIRGSDQSVTPVLLEDQSVYVENDFDLARTSPTIKQAGRTRGRIRGSNQSATPVLLEDPSVYVENDFPSSPATDTKSRRISLSVSPQPKATKQFRNSKTQSTSGSSRGMAARKFPVVCLTKISSQVLPQMLPPPSTETSNKTQSSKTRLQATRPKRAPRENFTSELYYVPATKRKTNNSSLLSLPKESLPGNSRQTKVFKDLRMSDISPSSSESPRNKRNKSNSPAKKQVAFSSRLFPDETSSKSSSQPKPTSEGNVTEKITRKPSPWSRAETEKLYKAVQKYGQQWSTIAGLLFPGVLPVCLANHWRSFPMGQQMKSLQKKFGPF